MLGNSQRDSSSTIQPRSRQPKMGRRSSLEMSLGSGLGHGARKYRARRMSMTGAGKAHSSTNFDPHRSNQFSCNPLMRTRVSALDLNMKRTEIKAKAMARRRGTLLHTIGNPARSMAHELIKFSLEDLWKSKKRRSPKEQQAIDKKANELFPKNRLMRRMSAADSLSMVNCAAINPRTFKRQGSLNSIGRTSRVSMHFLEKFWSFGKKICNVAATRIQARVRCYLHLSQYRLKQLERRWARIEYEKLKEIARIKKKTRAKKKAYKKRILQNLEELAEHALKARKLTDHLKRENLKIKDQNARLQQLCFKLRKVNNHMEKTMAVHNKNFRSMWEFVEKMKNKKKRIEVKVNRYQSRIEQQEKNVNAIQVRLDAEIRHKNHLVSSMHNIASMITARSSNEKLKELVEAVAHGGTMDAALLAEIDEDEGFEFNAAKSQEFDALCVTFHDTFVVEEDEETVDDGFLLALSWDDNSTISDVSSAYGDLDDESFTEFAGDGHTERDCDEATSVYEEVIIEDEDDNSCSDEVIEEIIEEEVSDGSVIEVVVESEEEEGEEECSDDFSCQSSVWVDPGSIIM